MVRPRHIGRRGWTPKTAVTSSCCETFHALTDRALVAAVAWKYIAYNRTRSIKPSKRHGSGFHTVCPNAIFLGPVLSEELDEQGIR